MIDDQLISQINIALSKEPKKNKFVPGGIKLAYVLGSSVSGRVANDSDFDLAVVVDNKERIDYQYLYNLISGISFPKDLDLSLVDKNSSPLFLFQIIGTGICVYQKSEKIRISFEAFVLKNYYDNAHLRKIYYSYLKQKFPYANQ